MLVHQGPSAEHAIDTEALLETMARTLETARSERQRLG